MLISRIPPFSWKGVGHVFLIYSAKVLAAGTFSRHAFSCLLPFPVDRPTSWAKAPTFQNYSERYVTKTRSNVQRDLGEGRIVQQFIHEHEVTTQLANSLCWANKELRQLQRWLLISFPDTASEYLFPEPGKLLEPVGEALLLHACQPIKTRAMRISQ